MVLQFLALRVHGQHYIIILLFCSSVVEFIYLKYISNYYTTAFFSGFINNGALFLGSYIAFFELYCFIILFFLQYQSPNTAIKFYTTSNTTKNTVLYLKYPWKQGLGHNQDKRNTHKHKKTILHAQPGQNNSINSEYQI